VRPSYRPEGLIVPKFGESLLLLFAQLVSISSIAFGQKRKLPRFISISVVSPEQSVLLSTIQNGHIVRE
jgi:hypothetical protein